MAVVCGQNATPSPAPDPNPPNIVSEERFVADHYNGGVDVGEEADLGIRINRDLKSIKSLQKQCERKKCPLIVLIDSRVTAHPDFSPTIEGTRVVGPLFKARNNKQDISIKESLKDLEAEHGTYMAGIIASQENGFGLIGINPNARLKYLIWNEYRNSPDDLANVLNEIWTDEFKNRKVMPIFVMATSWNIAATLASPEERDSDRLVRVINNRDYLFIVAAGQDEKRKIGKQITDVYADAPMNLGDKENVIVVTAYTQIEASTVLLPHVNYSHDKFRNMVHVAAPGDKILSTGAVEGNEIKYAFGHGTSPATAIVAGVTSLMLSKWPHYFRSPAEVKERLQIVSSPIGVGASHKIAAGLINAPSLALRDPEKDLVRGVGEADYRELTEFQGWGTDRINIWSDENKKVISETIATKDIYRLYQAPGDKWILYTQATGKDCLGGNCNGQIKKWGPAIISLPSSCDPKPGAREPEKTNGSEPKKCEATELFLFFGLDDRGRPERYYLSSVQDFILHTTTRLGYSLTSGH